jgi:hypothetical protein
MPAPPPLPEKGGANTVSGRTNPYASLSNAPTIYNSSITPVTYNGFQWSFSTGVSWGRFISGEPFIIVPAAGINITGVSYETSTGVYEDCPVVKTGYTYEAGQSSGIGVTMWTNGSMKNPKPFWESQDFGFTKKKLGATIYPWNYDERTSESFTGRKGIKGVRGSLVSFGASINDFLYFPVGLSAGDNLVTAKSSFHGNYESTIRPQGGNIFALWTGPEMNRMCIEKYGILTALSASPTYADCYRPPVFWNGASLASRPIFYRQDMVKNTEQYVIPLPEKNIKGITLNYNAENIINEQNNWNDFVNTMWISSHIPYYSGMAGQLAVGAYDMYNDDLSTSMQGYGGIYAKVKDKMMQAVYAPWVTPANRRKALDKVTQFAIDCWGIPNAGGIFASGAGHGSANTHPWIVWLGWLYNRPDMTKYYLGKQIQDRLTPGYTGAYSLTNPIVPLEYYYKHFLTSDYRQRYKVYGSSVSNEGFTGWVGTNPDIPLYHGLTSASKATSGACGFGWLYKATGISCAYGYTIRNINQEGQLITGSFGTIVCNKNTVFRLAALGPGTGITGIPQLPLSINANSQLLKRGFDTNDDCGTYWAYDQGAVIGLNLEITSGPGAGNTAYRILKGFNHFVKRGKVEEDVFGDGDEIDETGLGPIASLFYPTFILDRDFDNGAPTSESTIKIYPSNKNSVDWGFSIDGWMYTLGARGTTKYGPEQQTIYQQPSYNHISDEPIVKQYALSNWLGITEDQFLIDYVKDVYFNENLPDATRRQKFHGSPYVGEIFSGENELGGAIVGKMLGISGNQYAPTFIDDLGGMFDDQPAVPLDGITLEFIPEFISSYFVPGGSGRTYSGYGKIFSEPQTILKINAIIDDKIFTDRTQSSLYLLMSELKVQTGPFLSNNIIIEDTSDEQVFQDKVSFIDFGKQRNTSDLAIVVTDTSFVRKPLNLQNIYNINQIITQSNTPSIGIKENTIQVDPLGISTPITISSITSTGTTVVTSSGGIPLIKAKLNFVTNRYAMAGAVGIVPYPYKSCKLASSYEFRTLSRGTGPDKYKFSIALNTPIVGGQGGEYINLDNMYYCLASPRIPGGVTNNNDPSFWSMAEEYILENWRKIENPVLSNNTISFVDYRIPLGNPLGFTYGTNTTDKLIFFRYMIDKDYAVLRDNPVLVQFNPGYTGANIQTTTIVGGSSHPLFKDYKFSDVKIKNSPGNSGIFTFSFAGTSTSTDYRTLNYNYFRVYHNNYFDLDTKDGRRIFETFYDDTDLGNITKEYYTAIEKYNGTGIFNNKTYYVPKAKGFELPVLNSNPPNNSIGFYDAYIHGQTYNIFLPATPQTLQYVTGAT